MQRAVPVIVANVVTLALTVVILALKWRYAAKSARPPLRERLEPRLTPFTTDSSNRA